LKATIDTYAKRLFRWNGTFPVTTPQGVFVVPARDLTKPTPRYLHPSRVPPELLRKLNGGKEWKPKA
jgi:hypothetical protein